MKHILIILLLTCLCLASCEAEFTSQIGEDYVDVNTKVYFVDTLTVNASTIQFDSLIVSNTSRLLVGSYIDPVFGITTSRTFAKLNNLEYDIDNEAVFDSIALLLKYDHYSYNDTIPTQQFKVFEITEDIEPNEDSNFYNTAFFEYNPTPIGIEEFQPNPIKNDSIHIHLSDSFGETLFTKLQDNDINDTEDFLDEYKGILIDSDDSNTSIFGFDKGSLIRIYYTIDDETDPINKTIDLTFDLYNSFSQTSSEQTGTYFEAIENQETILESTITDNFCFTQSGTGIATRIDIPYLQSLNDITGEGLIIDAKLILSLKENNISENLLTKDELQVFIIDKNGNVLGNLTHSDGTPVIGVITNDNPEFESDTYTMDLKPFIDLKETETYEEYFLAIYPQDFNNSVDRYIFNGNNAPNNLQMKLELTYAVYDE